MDRNTKKSHGELNRKHNRKQKPATSDPARALIMKWLSIASSWITLVIALTFAVLVHLWHNEAMESRKLTDRAIANAEEWKQAAKTWESASMKWEFEATNSLKTAEMAILQCQICQSNFMAHLATHQSVTTETPFLFATNSPHACEDSWNLEDRSTWQFVCTYNDQGGWDLYVYGELIGQIYNCKFIPFQKP